MFNRLPIGQRLQIDVTQADAQHLLTHLASQVMTVTRAGVVGMRVSNHGAVNRAPGVDIKIPWWAIQTLRATHH
jgi:hypothetical protein